MAVVCATLLCPLRGLCQESSQIPVITGAFGFLTDLQPGHQEFGPKFEPILLLPLSDRFLIETEYSTALPVNRDDGALGPAVLAHSVEYMQLDYRAASDLTIVAGYFPTPFGIYKERIDPLWIRNILDEPLMYPINDNSSNGVMLRGGIFAAPSVKLNYAFSFSAPVSNSQFESTRQTTDRISLYFPKQRLEVGTSYSRILQQNPYDIHGFDVTWNATQFPLDLRGEGLWSRAIGHGYWVEAAYKFAAAPAAFLRHSQLAIRGEEFFPTPQSSTLNPDLPSSDTRRATFAWNYWFGDFLRANVAYARQWGASAAGNVVTLGLVYRFTFPGERN